MTAPAGLSRRQLLKYSALSIGLLGAGVGLQGCASDDPSSSGTTGDAKPKGELLPLKFAAVGPVPDFFHFQVATPLGMWKGVGLQDPPEYIEFPAGGPMIEAAAANQWSIGDIGGPPAITANTKFPLDILAAWDAGDIIELWVKPEDASAISSDAAGWLRGKSIAVTLESTGHYFIAKYLEKIGLQLSDVKLVNLTPGDREQVFLRGDVAAVVTWPPPSNLLTQRKMELVTTGKKEGIVIPSGVVARRDYLEKNRETALRFLKLHFQLIDMIRDDTDKFVSTQVKWFSEKGIQQDPAFLKTFHSERVGYYNLDEQIESYTPTGGGLSPMGTAFNDMAEFFLKAKNASAAIPDFGKIVDAQVKLLQEVKNQG